MDEAQPLTHTSDVDSDEDVITDYLEAATGDIHHQQITANNTYSRQRSQQQQQSTVSTVTFVNSSQHHHYHHHHHHHQHVSNQSGGRMTTGNPLVPIISVTAHSPGNKQYPVLDDNLAHLHDIHDAIQQMRMQSTAALGFHGAFASKSSRLSTSCPSLNETGSDADGLSSANSSPTHSGGVTSWLQQHVHRTRDADNDLQRRRSWTAVDDLKNNIGKNLRRHRSVSLSSVESYEQDESHHRHHHHQHHRTSRQTSSTHSLNEADLHFQDERQPLIGSTAVTTTTTTVNNHTNVTPRMLLQARLPLQKSVSTPSILAARDVSAASTTSSQTQLNGGGVVAGSVGAAGIVPTAGALPVGGTESETEEELLLLHDHDADHEDAASTCPSSEHFHVVNVPPNSHLHLRHLLNENFHGPSEKRRKRGSLFFRKKKDKNKKIAHQWVSVLSTNSLICDWCTKSLAGKTALACDGCGKIVHGISCKDQLPDCGKLKNSINHQTHQQLINQIPKRITALNQPPTSQNEDDLIGNGEVYRCATAPIMGGESTVDMSSLPEFSLDDQPTRVADLDTDALLGLGDDEPECWSHTVTKETLKKLKDKEIKRQEHIYEFILTEKHHCLTLRVMQKVFAEGFRKHFQLGPDVDRMFPRLAELTEIHFRFLSQLRLRQKTAPVIDTIADILLEQFSGTAATRLKTVYGEFCSRHRDAVDLYKRSEADRRFKEFARVCQGNPLLKKKGVPECILFVTQRLTKYPLLIEPLVKVARDLDKIEHERLQRALEQVKDILIAVNAQVAEKEREDRKLKIYHKIDAKSFTFYRGVKFKKSDILSESRQLRFEGTAWLMQGRGKMVSVLVILLSDVFFFLQENNNKYSFFTPDNKAGVVSLQKLLVREKAGQDSKGLYLISSHPNEPEMFELKIQEPKNKAEWIQNIRTAVKVCPPEVDEASTYGFNMAPSEEDRIKLHQARQSHIRQIVEILRQKDMDQALILEEKMALQLKLLTAAGLTNVPEPPSYCHLVEPPNDLSDQPDHSQLWQRVIHTVQEVSQLASSLYASGSHLSRSASSVGERQSDAYVSPTLPKRAETFGGFDNSSGAIGVNGGAKVGGGASSNSGGKRTPRTSTGGYEHIDSFLMDKFTWRDAVISALPPNDLHLAAATPGDVPPLLTLGHDQQLAAVRLSHYVYTLLCIIWQQMTSIDSLHAQLAAVRSTAGGTLSGNITGNGGTGSRQLEELRNLQDKLQQDREAWMREREVEERDLEEKRNKLMQLQSQVREQQKDIEKQRDQLYRKMELLTMGAQSGIVLTGGVGSGGSGGSGGGASSMPSSADSNTATTPNDPASSATLPSLHHTKWKQPTTKSNTLPPNLLSATNLHKISPNIQIKQQLPLKLAASGGKSPSSSSSLHASSHAPQQLLPMKLSQQQPPASPSLLPLGLSLSSALPSSSSPVSYQRLHEQRPLSPPSSQSPPPLSPSPATRSLHVRTGSSPAMMEACAQPQIIHTDTSSSANEEKVIFF